MSSPSLEHHYHHFTEARGHMGARCRGAWLVEPRKNAGGSCFPLGWRKTFCLESFQCSCEVDFFSRWERVACTLYFWWSARVFRVSCSQWLATGLLIFPSEEVEQSVRIFKRHWFKAPEGIPIQCDKSVINQKSHPGDIGTHTLLLAPCFFKVHSSKQGKEPIWNPGFICKNALQPRYLLKGWGTFFFFQQPNRGKKPSSSFSGHFRVRRRLPD